MADKNPKASESVTEEKSTGKSTTTETPSGDATPPKSKGSKAKQKTGPSRPSGKKAMGFLKFLLFLIFLAALAAAGWYGYQYMQSELQSRDERLQESSQQVAQLSQLITVTRQNQQNIERTLTSFIDDQQRQMQALAERVRAAEGVRDGDWILAEAQYLLRLADQRLLISRDTESAVQLLEAADSLLRDLAYPELVSVRQALISDISALRASPSIDYQGRYFQILSSARTIDSLSLKSVAMDAQFSGASADTVDGIWARAVQSLKDTLAQLIVIRRTNDSAQWLVDSEGEAALRGQLDLLVLQSLSALLSGDQEIYRSALNSVVEILELNFEQSSQREAVEAALLDYASQPIQAEVPDISNSLRAMTYGAELLRRSNLGE